MVTRSLSLAALALSISLAGCGDNTPAPPAPSPTSSTATPAATPATPSSAGSALTATTTPAAPAASEATQVDLQRLLDQATQNVKDGKLDLAEKAVAQLESMKPKMTPEWQGRVDQVRSALEAAKKGAAVKGGALPQGLKVPN